MDVFNAIKARRSIGKCKPHRWIGAFSEDISKNLLKIPEKTKISHSCPSEYQTKRQPQDSERSLRKYSAKKTGRPVATILETRATLLGDCPRLLHWKLA